MTSLLRTSRAGAWRGAAALFLALVLGGRAAAGPLEAGFVQVTAVPGPNTVYDFSRNPLAANALFPGSDPFTGVVPLHGMPFGPSLFGTRDAVIHMPLDANTPVGGWTTAPAEMMALALKSVQPVTITADHGATSHLYNVYVNMDWVPAVKGQGQLTFTGLGSGHFSITNGSFNLYTTITFQAVGDGPGQTLTSHELLKQAGTGTWVDGWGLSGPLVFHSSTGGLSVEFQRNGAPAANPEPASLSLAGLGAVLLLGWGWRRRRLG
jgi:hypothetical protein